MSWAHTSDDDRSYEPLLRNRLRHDQLCAVPRRVRLHDRLRRRPRPAQCRPRDRVRQVFAVWRSRPQADTGFKTTLFYRVVRHPLNLGFIVAFWAAPTMTAGHLLFAAMTTAWILLSDWAGGARPSGRAGCALRRVSRDGADAGARAAQVELWLRGRRGRPCSTAAWHRAGR